MAANYADIMKQLGNYTQQYDSEEPLVRLWDKNHNFICQIGEIMDLKFDNKVNAAGSLDLEIPYNSEGAQYFKSTKCEEVTMITVDVSGYRWHGALSDPEEIHDNNDSVISLKAVHNWQHLENIYFWANPLFPAAFQPLAGDYRMGPAKTVLASLLAVNLARLQLPLWSIPTYIDSFDQNNWNLFAKSQWPIAVKPVNPFTDTSRWCVTAPTFQSASEIIKEIVDDESGLSVEMNLWLPGDEQPWENSNFTKPTLWIDIQDYGIERHFTGTIIDGLLEVAVDALDDATEFVLYPILGEMVSGRDGQGLIRDKANLEIRDEIPVYRSVKDPNSGVLKHQITQHKPLASQVVVGGKSPEFVNKAIDLGVATGLQALAGAIAAGSGGAAAAVPGGAALAPIAVAAGSLDFGAAGDLFGSMLHDKLFAYASWENYQQAVKSGPFRYREIAKLGGTGLGLMLYQDIVNATYSQRSYTSHEIEVENGSPYRINQDIKLGNLVGIDIPDQKDELGRPQIEVARVTETAYTYDRNSANHWVIKLGDQAAEQDPGVRSLNRVKNIYQVLNKAATNQSGI